MAKTQTQASSIYDVDDTPETTSEFLAKVAQAKNTGTEWVETSPEVIKFYNPNGLGDEQYFIYSGIKVCAHGQSEKIIKELDMPMGQKIFGVKEAEVVGR